jgi:hypothetical protein
MSCYERTAGCTAAWARSCFAWRHGARTALRVRATRAAALTGRNWALLEDVSAGNRPAVTVEDGSASIANGNITCRINAEGWLSFTGAPRANAACGVWRNRYGYPPLRRAP